MSVVDDRLPPRVELARGLVVLAVVTLLLALPFGAAAIAPAAGLAVVMLAVALRETFVPTVTWASGVILFVAVAWLIPIKGYALPIELPFNLEHYRLLLLVLLLFLTVGLITRRVTLETAGAGPALLLLGGAAMSSALLNSDAIAESSGDPDAALKALSYFLSFLIVFVLITSVIETREQIDAVVRALVVGGVIVAGAALYESRFGYNLFDHLDEFLPGFQRQEREVLEERSGLIRVYASAQHPIALGTALLLVTPLALYLASQAKTKWRALCWAGGSIILLMAATATVSRTIVVMAIAMLIVGLTLRGPQVRRFWPLLLVLPFVTHVVAPGAMGGIYKAFTPSEGLLSTEDPREGLGGSGRLTDLEPGFRLWLEQPLFGHGLGQVLPTIQNIERSPGQSQTPLIFDNQYLGSLVRLGALGILGVLLFVWGSVIRLFRAARRSTGPPADLIVACTASAAGFGSSLLLFDAFAFVQATLVFFAVVAIGLRAKLLTEQSAVGLSGRGECA